MKTLWVVPLCSRSGGTPVIFEDPRREAGRGYPIPTDPGGTPFNVRDPQRSRWGGSGFLKGGSLLDHLSDKGESFSGNFRFGLEDPACVAGISRGLSPPHPIDESSPPQGPSRGTAGQMTARTLTCPSRGPDEAAERLRAKSEEGEKSQENFLPVEILNEEK